MFLSKRMEKQIEAYQTDLISKYCSEVEEMYRKMRAWRHDYHNHIQAMQASMALGHYGEVEAYLRSLNDDLTQVDTVVKTGRVMVDAILNGKISMAKKKGITVNVKASVPEKTPVSDLDLCVIIGNLLDNAIEENDKLPPEARFLRIYAGAKNTQFYLSVTNAAGKKQPKTEGLFSSSKGKGHGFGLARVRSLVQKYDGIFMSDSEDGGFTSEILLPLA